MQILDLDGVAIAGVCTCLPKHCEDNLARCTEVYGDAAKAKSIVLTTGIMSRRVVEETTSSLDLCVSAAETLLSETRVTADEIGAVINVTFTPERIMPCNACQAQHRLGLPRTVIAFDINLACSGWPYGLFVAGNLAKSTGKKVLLLDGDAQTPHLDASDVATVPVLADAGTATLLEPSAVKGGQPWRFAFLTDGEKGDALTLPFGGTLAMDGFGVFRFVTVDVLNLVRDFMTEAAVLPDRLDAFVPHQANVYMIRQIAKKLGLEKKLALSGDVFGNSSSATIPTTIAYRKTKGQLLVAGFGGGLSAVVGLVDIDPSCALKVIEL